MLCPSITSANPCPEPTCGNLPWLLPVPPGRACSGEGLAQLQPGSAPSPTSQNRIFHKPKGKGKASPTLSSLTSFDGVCSFVLYLN